MSTVDFTLNSKECVTLFYVDENPSADETLVFLHGLGTTHECWMHQITYFSQQGYRVIAMDTPGFGRSKINVGNFSIKMAAECVSKLIEHLEIRNTTIIGHSMGGPLAIYTVSYYPKAIKRCVLISTFAKIRPTSVSYAFAFVKRFVLANLQDAAHQAEFIARKTFPDASETELREMLKKQILTTDEVVYREAVNELAKVNLRTEISKISIPTLIMKGTGDQTISPVLQEELFTKISGARQVTIQGGRHGMIFSKHALVNHYLSAFLSENEIIQK
jgi:pimeloyl-ACP methyl ester carboxylesterase